MKKLFTLIGLISFSLAIFAQEFVPLLEAVDDTISMWNGTMVAVDLDDDGNLDIILSGDETDVGPNISATFMNNGDKTFTISDDPVVINPGYFGAIDHGDIDADGDIDFIFNGWGDGVNSGIAINDGSGGLSLSSSLEFGISAPTSGFADFNNDALLDYYFFGNDPGTCAIWFQNTDGTFTKDNSSFASLSFWDPDANIIDFNNDGYMDIFLTGFERNIDSRYSKVLINDYYGGFTASAQPNIIQKSYGSSEWYDINSDGHLDLILCGDGGADGEESGFIYRLYKNNNGTLEEAATFRNYRHGSINGSVKFADLDNDGDAEIILTGWNDIEGKQMTLVSECTDAANFTYVQHSWTNDVNVPGSSEADILAADFNNDHKIDFAISGFMGQYGRRVVGVVFNDAATANTIPGAPSNLVHDDIDGGGALFSWDAGTDGETPAAGLTYSLYLKDVTNSKWLINPEANLADGKRKVTGMGNRDNSTEWPIYELPDGDYEWSVQAVDAAYEGSAFPTPLEFTISDGVILGINNSSIAGETLANVMALNGELRVQFMEDVSDATIMVYSIDGRQLINASTSSGNFTRKMNDGMYLVNITSKGRTQTAKVVIY
jgi:hypothetical protein